jgi:nitroreductase
MSIYQERYLAHQKRKKKQLEPLLTRKPIKYSAEKKTLLKILTNRHSQRVFNGKPVTDEEIEYIRQAIKTSPSSCDRKAISITEITEREDKEILSGLLVGGVGWVNRADKILLIVADMEAYVSPAERDFMPYLDAGVIIQTVYLACEVQGIGCCYINPNIRDKNKEFFKQRFTNQLFCGALALGKY